MAGILGFFSNMFGYILNWIYNIDFIRNFLGIPYCVVSVGPDRSQTIVLNEIFK